MRVVRTALTFDDVLLLPAHSTVVPREVSLATRVSRGIELNIPVVSAAMDTVTESRLAIALAQEGGIGVVHKNLAPARQAAEVAKVKRFESGVVKDPVTIPPTMTVRELIDLIARHRISGMPVVEGKRVVGIVTNRDLRFETRLDQPVAAIMTPGDRLVTVPEGTDLETAKALMHRHRLDDDHRRAAHGALGVIGDMPVARQPVLGHVGGMRAEHDAVAQCLVADLQGLEQGGELVRHGASSV